MNEQGKTKQIIFEKGYNRNNLTGELELSENSILIWTDPNLLDVIKSVPGVAYAECAIHGMNSYYAATIDPRYDVEFIKREIEAAIIIQIGEL